LVNRSWYNFTTTEGLSVIEISPANNSVNIPRNTALITALINQSGGHAFNWSIETSPNIGTNSSNTETNGTKNCTISGNLSYQTVYTWYLNLSCAGELINETYYFTSEDLNPVSSFTATNFNSSIINLTWSKNSNVTTTHIVYKKDTEIGDMDDGTFLVNTTNTSYNHTGLDWGTHYYYKAWSYNSTDNNYSYLNTSTDAYTNPEHPSDFQSTNRFMESLEFSVTKGTNATRTVLFMNSTATGYPDRINGIEKDNTTSSTLTASGLEDNTIYNWSVYSFNSSSGLWSELNATLQESTIATSSAPSSVTAERQSHTEIIINWTKGSDYTIIRRNSTGYPATPESGTEVYNGTGATYDDENLDPATRYYYRLWGWNGEEASVQYSSVMNITTPAPPSDLVGEVSGNDLVITWTKGEGASRTVLRNDTDSQPYLPTDGYHAYNDTGTTTTITGISDINYYSGFSYLFIDGLHLYSSATVMTWGGIEINVYKESDPSIEINNYTVLITNSDGSETYQNTSANNPFRIAVSDVPNGLDCVIQISKDGYYSRSFIQDLYTNVYYNLDFYLPSHPDGGGTEGEPDYVPPSDYEDTLKTTSSSVANPAIDLTITLDCVPETIVQVQQYNSNTNGRWFVIPDNKYSVNGDILTVDSTVMNDDTSTVQVQYYCSSNESYGYQYLVTVQD
jgi:hypothetical protein